jgi:hypothetical protein
VSENYLLHSTLLTPKLTESEHEKAFSVSEPARVELLSSTESEWWSVNEWKSLDQHTCHHMQPYTRLTCLLCVGRTCTQTRVVGFIPRPLQA